MAFGKRRSGLAGPPQPSSASAVPLSALPGSEHIGRNLIQLSKGLAEPASGAARVEHFLLETYNDQYGQDGVNAETILSAAGALAGFAAQQAVWEGFVRTGEIPLARALARVETASGETYFFGDLLNTILASTQEGHLSIWSFVAAAALKAGAQTLPPLKPIFAHSAETVGTPAFGIPVLPGHLVLKELPRQALQHWPQIKSILLSAGVGPLHWPLEIGVAAQNLILRAQDALSADIGALVVMQAAIPMSKLDPRTVPGGTMVN